MLGRHAKCGTCCGMASHEPAALEVVPSASETEQQRRPAAHTFEAAEWVPTGSA